MDKNPIQGTTQGSKRNRQVLAKGFKLGNAYTVLTQLFNGRTISCGTHVPKAYPPLQRVCFFFELGPGFMKFRAELAYPDP